MRPGREAGPAAVRVPSGDGARSSPRTASRPPRPGHTAHRGLAPRSPPPVPTRRWLGFSPGRLGGQFRPLGPCITAPPLDLCPPPRPGPRGASPLNPIWCPGDSSPPTAPPARSCVTSRWSLTLHPGDHQHLRQAVFPLGAQLRAPGGALGGRGPRSASSLLRGSWAVSSGGRVLGSDVQLGIKGERFLGTRLGAPEGRCAFGAAWTQSSPHKPGALWATSLGAGRGPQRQGTSGRPGCQFTSNTVR